MNTKLTVILTLDISGNHDSTESELIEAIRADVTDALEDGTIGSSLETLACLAVPALDVVADKDPSDDADKDELNTILEEHDTAYHEDIDLLDPNNEEGEEIDEDDDDGDGDGDDEEEGDEDDEDTDDDDEEEED